MGKIKYDLKTPIKVDEKEIKTIELDLDKLDGTAIIEISNQVGAKGITSVSSPQSLVYLAARAADMIPEDLQKAKGPDAVEIMSIVNAFLSGALELTIYSEQLKPSEKPASGSQEPPIHQ